jgi:hypothetical protein
MAALRAIGGYVHGALIPSSCADCSSPRSAVSPPRSPSAPSPTSRRATAGRALCEIRREKFDRILPEAMRENGIDMWIVAMREGHHDPLWELLGRGYVGTTGYFIFTDRGGDRIERIAVGRDRPPPRGLRRIRSRAGTIRPRRVRARRQPAPHRPQSLRPRWEWPTDSPTPCTRRSSPRSVAALARASSRPRSSSPTSARAERRERARRVRRRDRDRSADRRARAQQRGHHAGRDHARRRRLVDPGAAARAGTRLVVRGPRASTSPAPTGSRRPRTTASSSAATSS